MNREIKELLIEIERVERQCLAAFNALPDWEPPGLTFLSEFHEKCDHCKSTHPDYYAEAEEVATKQQISILRTQLRIANELLKSHLK